MVAVVVVTGAVIQTGGHPGHPSVPRGPPGRSTVGIVGRPTDAAIADPSNTAHGARVSKSKIRYTEAISRGHSARAAEDSINPPDRLRGSITAMTAALGGGRRLLAGEIELAEVVSPPGMPACRGRPMRQ